MLVHEDWLCAAGMRTLPHIHTAVGRRLTCYTNLDFHLKRTHACVANLGFERETGWCEDCVPTPVTYCEFYSRVRACVVLLQPLSQAVRSSDLGDRQQQHAIVELDRDSRKANVFRAVSREVYALIWICCRTGCSPQLQADPDDSIFQQEDGEPPHWHLKVRTFLSKRAYASIDWPSPDLTVCDFFLWGGEREGVVVKDSVYVLLPPLLHPPSSTSTMGGLRNCITAEAAVFPQRAGDVLAVVLGGERDAAMIHIRFSAPPRRRFRRTQPVMNCPCGGKTRRARNPFRSRDYLPPDATLIACRCNPAPSPAATRSHHGESRNGLEGGEIWAAINIEVLRAVWSSVGMQGWGKLEIPEKTRRPAGASSMIPTGENPRATPKGIELGEQPDHYPTVASLSCLVKNFILYQKFIFRSVLCAEFKRTTGAEMKGRGKLEISEKTRQPTASSGTIPTCENPVTRPDIEPGPPWWGASVLITQAPKSNYADDLVSPTFHHFFHLVTGSWRAVNHGCHKYGRTRVSKVVYGGSSRVVSQKAAWDIMPTRFQNRENATCEVNVRLRETEIYEATGDGDWRMYSGIASTRKALDKCAVIPSATRLKALRFFHGTVRAPAQRKSEPPSPPPNNRNLDLLLRHIKWEAPAVASCCGDWRTAHPHPSVVTSRRASSWSCPRQLKLGEWLRPAQSTPQVDFGVSLFRVGLSRASRVSLFVGEDSKQCENENGRETGQSRSTGAKPGNCRRCWRLTALCLVGENLDNRGFLHLFCAQAPKAGITRYLQPYWFLYKLLQALVHEPPVWNLPRKIRRVQLPNLVRNLAVQGGKCLNGSHVSPYTGRYGGPCTCFLQNLLSCNIASRAKYRDVLDERGESSASEFWWSAQESKMAAYSSRLPAGVGIKDGLAHTGGGCGNQRWPPAADDCWA
ncbi:hypothetical protein PR048_026084 [Dryococelus australis]|uniref:Uncharacterized protein n=1 Tax=Dryococelus australis TaxID=614101 RepID=A0ABQ9GKB6_9NEOP|nr:hypothetical protein PR048_026084 [Dryococelus australis]